MGETPTFKNPPIVEFVLGAQFSPLTKLSAGHFGLLWMDLGEEWERPQDAPSISDEFELFDRPKWSQKAGMMLHIAPTLPLGRIILNHRRGDRLIQMQSTRFHLNWRKSGELKPSYKNLIFEFEEMFEQFREFVVRNELGELTLNQWELTYVDSFPQNEYWQTPADWSTFLPGLFGNLFSAPDLSLENRAAQWSYEIAPQRGRVHIAAEAGRWRNDPNDSLLITTTARGPIGKAGVNGLREGLDLGHKAAVESFLQMTSPAIQERWERMS